MRRESTITENYEKTALADQIKNKKERIDERQESENIFENLDNQLVSGVVEDIVPKPEPDDNIDTNLEEGYEPEKAEITVYVSGESITETVDWNEAKKISYWYTGQSEVVELFGADILIDPHIDDSPKISRPKTLKGWIIPYKYKISRYLRQKNLIQCENQEIYFDPKLVHTSTMLLVPIYALLAINSQYISNFINPKLFLLFMTPLAMVSAISLVLSIYKIIESRRPNPLEE